MSHPVSGFDLKFTSRNSWKAERRQRGQVIDIVPVTWTKGRREDPQTKIVFQEVWFRDQKELEERRIDRNSFVIALAIAKNYNELPLSFEEFRGLFEVVATGNKLSDQSIETKVIRRVVAE